MSYPEGLSDFAFCYMEGHHWDGGICSRCGEQLRCSVCGKYMTLTDDDIRKHAHMPCSPDCDGCDLCVEVAV